MKKIDPLWINEGIKRNNGLVLNSGGPQLEKNVTPVRVFKSSTFFKDFMARFQDFTGKKLRDIRNKTPSIQRYTELLRVKISESEIN